MKRDMYAWLKEVQGETVKNPMPILSFPAIQLLGISVKELISDSDLQAKGMKAVADRVVSLASVSLMDLSVEAECFGSTIRVSDDEVPTVVGSLVSTMEEAQALPVPPVGAGRTGIYLDAIRKAEELISDRPVFAGVIGPFSLAGRLLDVTEAMIYCYEDPDMVHLVLRKATDFIIAYGRAYREAGANGIVVAEPLAGMLSPALEEEFSAPYVKEMVEALQEEDFLVIYHNCGNNTVQMLDSILSTGCAAYHFGNAVSMKDILERVPSDVMVMGNVDPAGQIRNGTPQSVELATRELLEECGSFSNFVLSTGCDVPPMSRWENIDAFFQAAEAYWRR